MTPIRRDLLHELLLSLYRDGEPSVGNRRLRATLESAASASIGDLLPSNTLAQSYYIHGALDAWYRDGTSLVELRWALIRDNCHHKDRVDHYFAPTLACEAFSEADIPVAEDAVFADVDIVSLISLVNRYAKSDGPAPLLGWLERFAPLVEPGAAALPPPVLYLTLCEGRLTQASLRSVVRRTDLELPLPPGGIGIEFSDKHDLVERIRDIAIWAVRDHGRKWRLSSTADLVLVIEADPRAVSLQLETVKVQSTRDKLESWLTGVAWWPRIGRTSVEGGRHDGPLPAPGETVARWDSEVPADEHSHQRASLGVWAGPDVWSPNHDCSILGCHGRRYFAVLANQPLDDLLPQIHPNNAAVSLHDLFE